MALEDRTNRQGVNGLGEDEYPARKHQEARPTQHGGMGGIEVRAQAPHISLIMTRCNPTHVLYLFRLHIHGLRTLSHTTLTQGI